MIGPGASGSGRSWPRLALPGLPVVAPALSAGCRAATQDVVTYGGQLPRPEVVLVHDFTSDTNARSSRKPGSGPMAGAGAARGTVGATTATGIGADVVMGPQDAESDTRQAARAIARSWPGSSPGKAGSAGNRPSATR
jgi:hypothetical protein